MRLVNPLGDTPDAFPAATPTATAGGCRRSPSRAGSSSGHLASALSAAAGIGYTGSNPPRSPPPASLPMYRAYGLLPPGNPFTLEEAAARLRARFPDAAVAHAGNQV